MDSPHIDLVPYTQYNVLQLAKRLSELARSASTRLEVDFPGVLKRYATDDVALASVHGVKQAMLASKRNFGAYAVECNDSVVGVATFQQRKLRVRSFAWPHKVADGPMLAVWLGDLRSSKHRLLPAIMRSAVPLLANNPALRGHPWTLVRTEHAYVQAVLADENNGFGGFRMLPGPRDFSRIDGVAAARNVWTARKAVSQLD